MFSFQFTFGGIWTLKQLLMKKIIPSRTKQYPTKWHHLSIQIQVTVRGVQKAILFLVKKSVQPKNRFHQTKHHFLTNGQRSYSVPQKQNLKRIFIFPDHILPVATGRSQSEQNVRTSRLTNFRRQHFGINTFLTVNKGMPNWLWLTQTPQMIFTL